MENSKEECLRCVTCSENGSETGNTRPLSTVETDSIHQWKNRKKLVHCVIKTRSSLNHEGAPVIWQT